MLPGGRWRPERGVECFPSPPRRGRKAHVSRLAHALLARVGAQNLSCVVHAHVHICRGCVFSHLRLFCDAGAHGTEAGWALARGAVVARHNL